MEESDPVLRAVNGVAWEFLQAKGGSQTQRALALTPIRFFLGYDVDICRPFTRNIGYYWENLVFQTETL